MDGKGSGSAMEDPMKRLSDLEVERDYYRQVAERLGRKTLADAQDFSQMIRDLRQREIKLHQSQEQLEKTIEQRTADLVTSNKELHESTLRYDSLVKRLPHGVYTLRVRETGAMQFEYLSPPLCRILDIDPEEVTRNSSLAFSVAHPDDRERLESSTREATERRIPFRWEGRFIIRQDVRWIRIEADPTTTPTGDVVWNGVVSDITERRQIQDELQESEERLSSAAKAANFGVYSYDFDNGQAYYSIEFLSFYGLPPGTPLELDEDLTPKSLHPDDKSGFLAKMQSANDPCGSGILDHVFRIIRPDGQIRWLRVNGQTTFSGRKPSDHPLHANGIIQDITEGKRLGEEQRQWMQKRQQIQRAESLRTMAGAIAHHFNNQLAAVIGNLEIAIEDRPTEAQRWQILNDALQGARNAVEVSSLMLTYLGQTTGKRTLFDLSEICRQPLPLLLAAIPQNVLFTADLPTPGPIINANATHLQQTLTNLVNNAREAAGKDPATIDLTVKIVSPADIPESQRFPIDWQPKDATYACMEVKDTSGGIVDEDIEKLFDPFFSNKFSGRGLGLPVALGIVSAHEGAIAVKSEAGRGSTFRVYIPVSAEGALPQPDKSALPPAKERFGTVLLVEDQEIVRNMTETMLARMGFKVVTATDGVEAVEIFQQHLDAINIVLTDLSMPRMDGWETLSALRRIRPDIPVILLSGHDDSLVNAGDRAELPQVFLHKPFQKAALKDALARALEGLPMNYNPEGNTTPSAGDLH